MGIIFRIMSAIKSKKAFSINAMNISSFSIGFIFTQNQHIRFDFFSCKRCGLSHKSL